jgi:hypothetical protein
LAHWHSEDNNAFKATITAAIFDAPPPTPVSREDDAFEFDETTTSSSASTLTDEIPKIYVTNPDGSLTRRPFCKLLWKGQHDKSCKCNRIHTDICKLPGCKPVRDPDCLFFHASGKGRGGPPPPPLNAVANISSINNRSNVNSISDRMAACHNVATHTWDSGLSSTGKWKPNCEPPSSSWSYPRSVPNSNNKFFAFGFANETRIAKIICRLKPTKARGVDDIPASILKLGVSVLTAPIARLVNVSLASEVVPQAFKTAMIVPVYKGKGKSKQDPASYRPIALLPSMAKVLEIVVRDNLEAFLASMGALPDTQYGYRPARSASMALGTAEAAWQAATLRIRVIIFIVINNLQIQN